MSRPNRIIYEGSIYHIYQRGNNKEYIFQDDYVKGFILKCLEKYNKIFDYEVLAYVIMNNHYHLLIKTNKSPINQVMFYINNLLGKYINNSLERTGHAFEGRYKCKLIDSDAYLIWVLRYIHRNPIKANICSELGDYPWSSHYFYKNNINSNINTKFILSMLGDSPEYAVRRYLALVNSNGDEIDKEKDYNIIKEIFKLQEAPLLNNGTNINEPIKYNRRALDEIICNINVNNEKLIDIRNGSKKQNLTPIKIAIIKGALEECYSVREIADFLNAAPSTISKLISRTNMA